MKIAIIYSTLIDSTEKSALLLKELINSDVLLIPVEKAKSECILKYNLIILAGSSYNSKVQTSLKIYISRNIKTLLEKPIGLYVNSDENLSIEDNLNKVFTKELIESSLISSNFVYELDSSRGNFIERRKTKKLIENNENLPSLNIEEIKKYANFINNLIEKRVD